MPNEPALRPVQSVPGVLVHPSTDRRLAAAHWLLSTLRNPAEGRRDWERDGVAVLPLGTLFSAVRMPAALLLALVGDRDVPSPKVDALLDEVLDGGPVICDPSYGRYYALVPASMPTTWRDAATEWHAMDVDVIGRGIYLGVPSLEATEYDPYTRASYWSVPMASAAELCPPLSVARLIAAGRHAAPEMEVASDEEA